MRRRAAFYLFLGLVIALLIVALATGLQTHGSTNPNVWMGAHLHTPLLQMLDLASLFLFVVIGFNGVMVSRLQFQLRHQAEDFGDQMQSLLHRNEELVKVNEEYAEQIAALEVEQETPPALSLGDTGQKVIAALHWQVDAQARQLEAVHQALAQQHAALEELQQHVQVLEGNGAPALNDSPVSPQLAEAVPPLVEVQPEPTVAAAPPASPAEFPAEEPIAVAEWTGNDGSTLIGEMLEFDVSALVAPEPAAPARPKPIGLAGRLDYPLDDSFLAFAAGHLSSIPEPTPDPPQEPERSRTERIEISVAAPAPSSPAAPAADQDIPPPKTQAAAAFDMAESALSSLQSETQEALSSLRAQVEATLPPESTPPVSAEAEEPPAPPARRKPWHRRF